MTIAPAQKDLLTGRWRKVKAPQPKEHQIQIALVDRLKLQCRRNCVWFHVPNGELREDKASAAKLKAMGVLPGVADLVFVWLSEMGRLRVLFLELKARGRKPTPEQIAVGECVKDIGAYWECADSIDAAVAVLQRHGILPE